MNTARVIINKLTDTSYTADVEISSPEGELLCVLNCTTESIARNLANIINTSVNAANPA